MAARCSLYRVGDGGCTAGARPEAGLRVRPAVRFCQLFRVQKFYCCCTRRGIIVNQVENVVPAKATAQSLGILLLICAGALSVIIIFALEDMVYTLQGQPAATAQSVDAVCKIPAQVRITLPLQIRMQCEMPAARGIR